VPSIGDEVAPDRFSSLRRWVKKAAGVSLVLMAGVAMTACSTVVTKAANSLALTASDSMKTIQVRVPGRVTVTLPYDPASGMIWQLVSGGAGFSTVHSPVFHDRGSGATAGTEEFFFAVKDKGTLPVVLDYVKPGPITGAPKQFKVTLRGT
jgi:predicted secreted protein